MNQNELVQLHRQLSADAEESSPHRRAHYNQVLAALDRLIESFEPATEEIAIPASLGGGTVDRYFGENRFRPRGSSTSAEKTCR